MKRLGKILITVIQVIIVLYVIGVTALLLNKNKFGYIQMGEKTYLTVNKDNAEVLDGFEPGDLVFIDKVRYSDVSENDTLYFYDVSNNEYVIRSGSVKEITGDKLTPLYIMENSRSLSADKIVGKFNGNKKAGWGSILDILSSRYGFLFLVIFPVFMILIYQVYKMILLLKEDDSPEIDLESTPTSKPKEVKEDKATNITK